MISYIGGMKQIATVAFCCALIAPATQAEEAEEGLSLMERGAQMFLEGILKEMEPAIDEFQGFADDMGPALRDFAAEMGPKLSALLDEIEDWSVYEAPEVLPNGDIIIRRKPDAPAPTQPEDPAPQIEL